jgi:two-component system CheB/CheR fusion protein
MFTASLLDEEDKKLSGSGKDYLRRMQSTVQHMQLLIKDLLTYTNTKKIGVMHEKTDLHKATEEVIDSFQATLKEKKGLIKTTAVGNVNIACEQFRQVLENLIGNALKFTHPKRAPRITIKSSLIKGQQLSNVLLSPKQEYCHLSVSDNGLGFDPKYKDQIFEVFKRLHGQKEYEGTGMGLAICKRIIENHKGVITATGVLNKGTRIDMYIPVYENL